MAVFQQEARDPTRQKRPWRPAYRRQPPTELKTRIIGADDSTGFARSGATSLQPRSTPTDPNCTTCADPDPPGAPSTASTRPPALDELTAPPSPGALRGRTMRATITSAIPREPSRIRSRPCESRDPYGEASRLAAPWTRSETIKVRGYGPRVRGRDQAST
jgi:hypothetical protein